LLDADSCELGANYDGCVFSADSRQLGADYDG
jgi:hypothetical protein